MQPSSDDFLGDITYGELIRRLANDLPTLAGLVQASVGASSTAISQPAQGSTLVWDAAEKLYVPSNATPGQLLAAKTYAPGTAVSPGVASNTWTYLDTTNLAIAATVPPSGRVIVHALGGVIQSNGSAQVYNGVNTAAAGAPPYQHFLGIATNTVGAVGSAGAMQNLPYQIDALFTGLTPGSKQTFYLGLYCAGTNANLYLSSLTTPQNGGPMLMTVTAA